MALRITGQLSRAVGFRDIEAHRTTSHSFDNFMQLKILQREYSQIAIITGCDDPVLFTILTDPKCHQIVNYSTIEPQDHVWIYLVNLMLIVTNDVIKASVIVDFGLDCNTVFDVFEFSVQNRNIEVWAIIVTRLIIQVCRTCLLLLLMGTWIVIFEIVSFNRILKDLDDLLAGVLLETRVVLAHFTSFGRLPALIIDLLVNLCQVLVLACWNPYHLLISIRISK